MFWTTITPALFYATPIVYVAPKEMGLYMTLNPFAHFMELIRAILYKSQFPKLEVEMWEDISRLFLTTSFITLTVMILSLFIYNKLRKGFISNF
jgi:ABC-type polysaccharide/polyol phosphate export permease